MANEKILNTRIALKIDTLANWNDSTIILKKGELAIATVASGAVNGLSEPVTMIKIGDGKHVFSALEWNFYAKASDVLAACKTEDGLKAFINGVIANNNLASAGDLTALTTRVTTAEGDIDNLEAAVDVLNGDATVAGSVAKSIADAIAALNLDTTYVKIEADKSLVSNSEITKLAGVSAGANKVEASTTNGNVKIDGTETVVYNDSALTKRVGDAESKIGALETASAKHALKTELEAVDAKFADYTKTADLPTDLGDFTNNAGYAKTADVNAELNKKADKTQVATDIATAIAPLATTEALNGVKATAEAAAVKTEVEAALALKADKSVVDAMYTNSKIDELITGEKNRAEGIESGLRTDVDAIKADYLKAADKTELQGNIDTLTGVVETLRDGIDADKVDGIKDLIDYVDKHGTEVTGMKEDIAANTAAIAAEAKRAGEAEVALSDRITTLEGIDHEAYKAADTALHTTISQEIDSDIAAAIAAEVTRSDAKAQELATAAQTAAEKKAGELDTALHTVISKEIDDDVNAAIEAEVSRANGAYDAKGDAAQALADAKAYANGLAGNYATKAQGEKADTALQSVSVLGKTLNQDSAVISVEEAKTALGLGTAAYTDASAYATAAQGTKADTALQKADITTGSTNGTIAVGGTDVAVKGLGSAAYTESSAYATSEQGAKADSALQEIKTTANGGLKVTNKNQIDFDPDVVFVFNCGDASDFVVSED